MEDNSASTASSSEDEHVDARNSPSKSISAKDMWGYFFEDDMAVDGGAPSSSMPRPGEVRDAWMKFISSFLSGSKTQSVKRTQLVENKDFTVLYRWINDHPSQSFKMSSTDLTLAMNLSCCVSGFRICQMVNSGEIKAQFNFIFAYGSRTYSTWKSFSEFKDLAEVVDHVHTTRTNPIFRRSLRAWRRVEGNMRWWRSLSVPYLIEKSILLGNFMECLLMDCPSPGILLCFVQSERFSLS
jgi:hypothetical protein